MPGHSVIVLHDGDAVPLARAGGWHPAEVTLARAKR
jgi:hypothetical protein